MMGRICRSVEIAATVHFELSFLSRRDLLLAMLDKLDLIEYSNSESLHHRARKNLGIPKSCSEQFSGSKAYDNR